MQSAKGIGHRAQGIGHTACRVPGKSTGFEPLPHQRFRPNLKAPHVRWRDTVAIEEARAGGEEDGPDIFAVVKVREGGLPGIGVT